MRFPEWLYQLLAGDAGTQQLTVIWRDASGQAANVTVSAEVFVVPNDKCLVLTNATVWADPGAGQTTFRRRLFADPPDGTKRYNIVDDETNGADAAVAFTWSGEVVVPGGWKVKVEGTFNAAALANDVNAEIHGYLVPRGTFVFG